jgi:pyruvate formate lyase activating enzyme
MIEGTINRILPFSNVDGPGNRTVVFFQGCNFRCAYCHNPETIGKCTLCAICQKNCPANALSIDKGKMKWIEKLCQSCDKCIAACPFSSDPRTTELTVEHVIGKIKETALFISGVTFSGGECTLQMEFLYELVKSVNQLGLTTCVDTNGSMPLWNYPDLVKEIDMFILDVKSFSPWKHNILTEADNEIILKNLHFLGKTSKLYEVRTVIAPDVLDNENTVRNVSSIIAKINPDLRYKLIKCQPHGLHNDLLKECPPSDEYMDFLRDMAVKNGCNNIIVT